MIDVILAPPAHITAVNQVKYSKDNAWYGYDREEIELVKRVEKDAGKNNCGHRT